LDDPAQIQAELDRRMEVAKKTDPMVKREENLSENKFELKRTSID
jgi:hypothetical protein